MLLKRAGDKVNEFWISFAQKHPALSILVKNYLATLHFFPNETNPGLRSIGPLARLDPYSVTHFCTESVHHAEVVANRFVIPFAAALRAAEEFLAQKTLPTQIEWLQL